VFRHRPNPRRPPRFPAGPPRKPARPPVESNIPKSLFEAKLHHRPRRARRPRRPTRGGRAEACFRKHHPGGCLRGGPRRRQLGARWTRKRILASWSPSARTTLRAKDLAPLAARRLEAARSTALRLALRAPSATRRNRSDGSGTAPSDKTTITDRDERLPQALGQLPRRTHRTAFAEVSGVDGRFLRLVECQLAPSAPQITRWPDSRRSYKAGVGGSSPSAPTRSEAVFGGPAASLPTGMGSLPHRPPLPSQLPPVAPSHRLTVDHIAVRARPGDSGVDVVIRPLLAAARQNAAMRGGVAMSVAGEGEVCRMP
jgi:hypothetical protein